MQNLEKTCCKNRYHLVILELKMPIDGLSLARLMQNLIEEAVKRDKTV
jgi:DNA-binding response OmpR family regulator